MLTILKCKGGDCPLKGKCYRYLSPFDDLYFESIPWDGTNCEQFWEVGDLTIWQDLIKNMIKSDFDNNNSNNEKTN